MGPNTVMVIVIVIQALRRYLKGPLSAVSFLGIMHYSMFVDHKNTADISDIQEMAKAFTLVKVKGSSVL